jgi:protocatechuate 3,4-dioxygenase beta subunit
VHNYGILLIALIEPLSHQKRDLTDLETWATYSHNETTSLGYQLDTPEATIFGSNNTCALVPETTIGPYYVTGEFIRQDITEGQAGVPLHIELQFVDMTTCAPVADVVADVSTKHRLGVFIPLCSVA